VGVFGFAHVQKRGDAIVSTDNRSQIKIRVNLCPIRSHERSELYEVNPCPQSRSQIKNSCPKIC
jgi:hypothetical protein